MTILSTQASNPGTLPTGAGAEVAFSPDGAYVGIAHAVSPRVSVYPWSGSAFGSKVANPATLPTGDGAGIAWSPNGNYVAIAHATSPFLTIYPWSGGAFGTKLANPATLPAGAGKGVAWSPDSAYVAVAHTTTPFISVYPVSGTTIGAKIADAGTLAGGNGARVAFSPDGAYVGLAHAAAPRVTIWPWTGAFGSKVANAGTPPVGNGLDISWSPDGAWLAIAHATSPFFSVYAWSAGFGSRVTDPSGGFADTPKSLAWALDSAYISIDMSGALASGRNSSRNFAWASGYGAETGLLTSDVESLNGAAWGPSHALALASDTSPFILAWAAGTQNLSLTASEGPTTSESAARVFVGLRTATAAPTTSEAATRVDAAVRATTDAPHTSESAARVFAGLRAPTDAPHTAESAARTGTFLRSATDAPVVAESIASLKSKNATTTEAPTTSEAMARLFSGSRTATAAPTLADSAARVGALLRATTDAPHTAEANTDVVTKLRTASESPATADSASRTGVFARTATEAPVVASTATRALALFRAGAESPATSEALARLFAGSRATAESPTVALAAVRGVGLSRTATEAPHTAESVARGLVLTRTATAAPTTADAATRRVTLFRTTSEHPTIGESLATPAIHRRLRAIQYHVLILSPDSNGGPGAPKLELDPDVLNLVWQQNLNLSGAAAFAMARFNPKLSQIAWMQDHIQIVRESSAGVKVVFVGKLTKPQYSSKDVLVYAQDYLSFLQLSRTGFKTAYASKKLGSEVIGVEWAAAKAVSNSPFAFVTTGTIEDPVGLDGSTIIKTNSDMGVVDFDRLFTFHTLAEMAMANTTNNVKFEITRDAPYTFNLWKNYGSRAAKYALTHPGNLTDYEYDPGYDQYRNDLATALSDAAGGQVEYSVATTDVATTAYRRLQAAMAIRTLFGVTTGTTETDQGKAALAYQLQVLTRIPRTVALYPRQDEIQMFDGWDVGDRMWSILQKADRTGDEFAGDLRLIGVSVSYNPFHGEMPVLYGRGVP